MPLRQGRKSASQTPTPKSERIYGSKKNPKGSASSSKSAKNITFSDKTIKALQNKLDEFKEKHKGKKNITLGDLKAVYRRGSGAYSSSHRPGISRNGWAMARVNKFLLKAGGTKVKAAYVQDDDLMKMHLGGDMSKHLAPNGKLSNLTHEQWHLVRTPEFKAWFGFWEENLLIDNFLSKRHFVMGNGMITSISNSKILNSIISLIPIDVMDKFGSEQLAIDMLFHNVSMFVNILSLSQRDSFIIPFMNESIIFITITRAKLSNTKPTSSDAEMLSAINTLQDNLVFVINTFAFSSKFSTLYDVSPFAVVRAKFFIDGINPTLDAIIHSKLISDKDKEYYTTLQSNSINTSKVVDENGEPLVVYHGTDRKFTTFNKRLIGSSSGEENKRNGFYFTSDYATAKYYADYYDEEQNYVMTCFLNLRNPIIKSKETPLGIFTLIENAFDEGRDGVLIESVTDSGRTSDQIISFDSNQIKLADGTNTTFDGGNPDIRYAEGGDIDFNNVSISTITEMEEPFVFNDISVPPKSIYVWMYNEHNSQKKIDNGEYDIVKFEKGISSIWQKEFQKTHNGSDKLMGVIKGRLNDNNTKLYLLSMTTKPSLRKKGVMSTLIKKIREKYNIDKENVVFIGLTEDGKKFYKGKKYADGGEVNNCKKFILQNKSVLRNGFYFNMHELSKLVDPYGQVPLNLDFTLVSYNSGGQSGLGVIDTINPTQLISQLTRLTNITKNQAYVVAHYFMDNAKRLTDISQITTEKIVVVDRDRVVCENLNEYAEGGEVDEIVYHGSPNKFEKFELEKVGTTTGRLTGGYGIYFTNKEEVAKEYALKGGSFIQAKLKVSNFFDLDENITDVDKILEQVEQDQRFTENDVDNLKSDFLGMSDYGYEVATNRQLHEWLSDTLDEQQVSEFIEKLGYDGTTFVDKWDKDARNYVIFNPNDVEIVDIEKLAKGKKLKSGGGDCYYIAGQFAMDNIFSPKKIDYIGTPYLVHAEVQGQGHIAHIRYGHAWVEDDENVYDFSNGRELVIPKPLYYAIGQISTDNPKKYQKYTFAEARQKMVQTKHYGCWDLDVEYREGGEVVTDDEEDLYDMIQYQKLQKNFKDGGDIDQEVTCINCGWHWNTKDSEEFDKYVCHNCGFDNTLYYSDLNDDIMSKLKTPKTLSQIAEIHKVSEEVLAQQLQKGIETEMEHTTDQKIAETIALHHIEEMPDYYDRLKEMESGKNIIKSEYKQNEMKKVRFVGDDRAFWYVISETPEYYIGVIDEKLENWQNADQVTKVQYFEDYLPKEDVEIFEKTTDQLKEGGVVVGKRHSESDENGSGERFLVKSTGQVVELEGGEGVLNKESMTSNKTYEFQGKKMSARQIASFLNHKYGGVEFAEGGDVKSVCGCKSYYHGGELPSATLDNLEGGEAVVTVKTMESKEKYQFQGMTMTPRKILSQINADFGGKKFDEGGTIDISDYKLQNEIKLANMYQFVQKLLYHKRNIM